MLDASAGGMSLRGLGPSARLLVLFSSLGLVAACGSTITEPDDGVGGNGGSDGPGAGDQGGQAQGGQAQGGSDPTGGGTNCSDFADAPEGDAIRISIRNDSPLDVYLPADCNSLDFSMRRVGSEEDYYGNVDGFCLTTCEDFQTGSGVDCEPCAPGAMVIAAFSSMSVIWKRIGIHVTQMPATCWLDDVTGPRETCSQIVGAEAGDYVMQALAAYSACDGCECDGELCFGFPSGALAFTSDLSFSLPLADDSLEYVIDSCAFGCPEPADDGG